ncbi:MAG: AI-2E family transporter [Thermoleophilia bacterium]|nr:AI-2E family transporter [Thermoleophilia bacterium]
MIPERLVRLRARTVLSVVAIVISVAVVLQLVWLAREVIAWILISLFFALALNPSVEFLMRRGIARRGYAVAITYVGALLLIAAIGALFIPTLIDEIDGFREALPGYVEDVTEGRGPLGRLAERYDLVERVRTAVEGGDAARLLGLSGAAVAVAKGILTAIVAIVTIAFMTFFMLLEGPAWMERFYSLVPDDSRLRAERIARNIYRTIGGYVTGNLLISVIAGAASTLVLLIMDVRYAVALGLLVAILDLVPLAGATLAAIIVTAVAFLTSVPAGIVVLIFFIVYQQIENHLIQPVVYSRTVQLSPLAILVTVLIGAKLAGILGALAAIPTAGTIQVVLLEWLEMRRLRSATEPEPKPL